jgi:hypothetical protein
LAVQLRLKWWSLLRESYRSTNTHSIPSAAGCNVLKVEWEMTGKKLANLLQHRQALIYEPKIPMAGERGEEAREHDNTYLYFQRYFLPAAN